MSENKECSKIVSIELVNFMAIEHAVVTFSSEGVSSLYPQSIISLCGWNDAGKSIFRRAISILFYNSDSGDQSAYIRDNTDYFELRITYSDGISISKTKYINGNSVWEMKRGTTLLYSNQKSKSVIAVTGVPEIIRGYLQVVIDEVTGEALNVRSCEDKMFLVKTTGGENYKMFSAILQSETLARASAMLNADKNKSTSSLLSIQARRDAVQEELRELQLSTPPMALREGIRLRQEKLNLSIPRYTSLCDVIENRQKMNSIVPTEELTLIDTSQLLSLIDLQKAYDAKDVVIQPECILADPTRLDFLGGIISARGVLDKKVQPECSLVDVERLSAVNDLILAERLCRVKVQPECRVVESSKLADITSVYDSFKVWVSSTEALGGTEKAYAEKVAEVGKICADLGVRVCDVCGNIVETLEGCPNE